MASPSSDKKSSAQKLTITLKRSLIGRPATQRRVATALGLRRSNDVVCHDDSPTIRGMVNKISHLITVEGA